MSVLPLEFLMTRLRPISPMRTRPLPVATSAVPTIVPTAAYRRLAHPGRGVSPWLLHLMRRHDEFRVTTMQPNLD